ncbi:MAG: stage V sporulation protein AA [Candidatus Cohnella colombiensis]|uniref:Stage V sporulation protein AA n=1 Tax=Candidatus Cohnella colombiensis TaxID=3121368 RepID=A0AA95EZ48_9BACL|nr:MAG: stage V sporulation protein AA [Cohnella sp.]
MEQQDAPIVYVRLRRRIVVKPNTVITLGQVARIVTTPALATKLNLIRLLQVTDKDGNLVLIDMLQIVQAIREAVPRIVIESFGEPHVLLEVTNSGDIKPRKWLLVLVWLLLFFGSGMAMMNFHADVNMPAVQMRITELITGHRTEHPWLFQIPYSLGVGLGMLLFFNRLLRLRHQDEPTPLEVEMFMYQENVNHFVITEEYRKKQEERLRDGRG